MFLANIEHFDSQIVIPIVYSMHLGHTLQQPIFYSMHLGHTLQQPIFYGVKIEYSEYSGRPGNLI